MVDAPHVDHVVAAFERVGDRALHVRERAGESLRLANQLRADGFKVETGLDPSEKLGKQFRYADQRGIPFALVLGPDDLARGEVVVKDLRTGEQRSVARVDVAGALRREI